MREVVNSIQHHRLDARGARELDPLYADLYDHVLRVSEWTESLRDMIATIFETNLSLQDARLNTVMKKLTGWAAIIAVPTAITGFYGQNVPYPGFGTAAGFILSTTVILVLMVVLYAMFRRLTGSDRQVEGSRTTGVHGANGWKRMTSLVRSSRCLERVARCR